MKINHNIPALRTLNELNKVNNKAADSMLRLSSGLRINSAADDAAGLAIANKMDAQIRGLRQANRNTMDGISLVQTAEGALNEVHAILQRMRELSVQAANGTYSEDDLEKIQLEVDELTEEINRIGDATEFNTKPLLKGKDEETNLFINDLTVEAGGTGTWTLRSPLLEEDLEELAGKKLTINGEEVTFFDSASSNAALQTGGANDIDLRSLINTANPAGYDYADTVANRLANTLTRRTGATVSSTGNPISFTSTATTAVEISNGGKENYITIRLQVGANKGQVMDLEISDMRADALGLTGLPGEDGFTAEANVSDGKSTLPTRSAVSVQTNDAASSAITVFNDAISTVSQQRAKLGAAQNRLEHTTNNLSVSEENLTESMSRIQDADMAYEMAQFTQQNILSQAATSMLAQANQRPQQVLQLLQ